MTGEDGSPMAVLDALRGDSAFMERVDKRDATAQAQLDQAYMRAFPDEPAGSDAGDVRIDRGTGADVPSTFEAYGVAPELEAAADPGQLTAFREAAHQAGMTRGDFAELSARYYALASKADPAATPEQFDQAMARWHGPKAGEVLEAARRAAQRAIAANPALAEVLAVIGNDPSAVSVLGTHELHRTGAGKR